MYNIHYPRLTYAYPCLKSVNILCLVIKAEDLRHKPYLIHFRARLHEFIHKTKLQGIFILCRDPEIFTKEGRWGAPKMKDNFVFQGVGVHGLFLFSVTLHCKFFICLKFQGEWSEQPPPPLQPSLTTP